MVEVELVGGPLDGQVLLVPEPSGTIEYLATIADPNLSPVKPGDTVDALPTRRIVYRQDVGNRYVFAP